MFRFPVDSHQPYQGVQVTKRIFISTVNLLGIENNGNIQIHQIIKTAKVTYSLRLFLAYLLDFGREPRKYKSMGKKLEGGEGN